MAATLPSLTNIQPQVKDRLLATQEPSGGWGEHPGSRLSTMNTAEVVLALTGAGVAAGNPQIKKAVAFMYSQRHTLPAPDDGCWSRSTGPSGAVIETPDIIRTCLIVRALVSGGEDPGTSNVRTGIDWLLGRQNADDRGWAFQRGQPAAILPTCFALLALMRTSESADSNPWKNAISDGLTRLVGTRNKSGSFGSGTLEAAHTIHAVLVLQAARECKFAIPPTAETDALQWLLSHPDAATSTVEEQITIDPNGQGNWGYLFSMDALLLVALGRSAISDHRKALWAKVQRSVHGYYDESSGGIYGQRVFSWSTAAGLYAISLTGPNLGAIPASTPEDPSGTKVGAFILFFAVVLVGALLYLSARGFTTLQALFLGFLMLACLLAYGKIGEKTFQQLVEQGFKGGGKDA